MNRRLLALTVACGTASCAPAPSPFDGAVDTPRLFAPGVVSTDAREYGIALAPDLREAYFARRGRRGPTTLLVTRFVDGAWSEPEPLPFASVADESPYLTPDGRRLLFSSGRPVPGAPPGGANLWIVARGPDGAWGTPEPLPGAVNVEGERTGDYASGDEVGPSLVAGDVLLYSSGTSAEWGSDLYVAEPDGEGGWGVGRALRLNTYGDEANPAMTPDGSHLLFQAYRDAAGPGLQDLYVSERTDFGWGPPRPLPEPINTAANEGFPSFTPDGRLLFFASDRDARNGYYDIYYVRTEALGLGGGPGS